MPSAASGYPGARPLDTNGLGLVLIAGSFTCVNGSDPTIRAGKGWTVARTAEGRYTVTLTQKFQEIVSVLVQSVREVLATGTTTGVAELVQVYVDQDTLDEDSFEIQVGLTGDIATGAFVLDDQPGSEIHFQLVGRYSSIDY